MYEIYQPSPDTRLSASTLEVDSNFWFRFRSIRYFECSEFDLILMPIDLSIWHLLAKMSTPEIRPMREIDLYLCTFHYLEPVYPTMRELNLYLCIFHYLEPEFPTNSDSYKQNKC
ncbi:hypothetical protein HanXRQr2_Chr13g0567411 [Helianthus annuus]|uniref:Uncharacterized protein n=1 Tax=Helianthus annuus TaxID=4232 RepID=A0A9K3HAU2_HELAN|nr:hypothetical protein HanXRQr2_Chr13g0567411 [Helianthus annuus]